MNRDLTLWNLIFQIWEANRISKVQSSTAPMELEIWSMISKTILMSMDSRYHTDGDLWKKISVEASTSETWYQPKMESTQDMCSPLEKQIPLDKSFPHLHESI